jgi:hypothetical protein
VSVAAGDSARLLSLPRGSRAPVTLKPHPRALLSPSRAHARYLTGRRGPPDQPLTSLARSGGIDADKRTHLSSRSSRANEQTVSRGGSRPPSALAGLRFRDPGDKGQSTFHDPVSSSFASRRHHQSTHGPLVSFGGGLAAGDERRATADWGLCFNGTTRFAPSPSLVLIGSSRCSAA